MKRLTNFKKVLLIACTSVTFNVNSQVQADLNLLEQIVKIESVINSISTEYFQEIPRATLNRACLSALGEINVTSESANAMREQLLEIAMRRRTDFSSINSNSPTQLCISAVFKLLNQHSEFIGTAAFQSILESSREGAIGLELVMVPEGAKIVSTLPGSPAERAGIKSGELLVKINGKSLEKLALADVVRTIRGPIGEETHLEIFDPSELRSRSLNVKREIIRLRQFHTQFTSEDLIYIKIRHLGGDVPREIAEGINKVIRDATLLARTLRGIVLDLRACQGGSIDNSVAIAAAFLQPGNSIAELKGRIPKMNISFKAELRDYSQNPSIDPLKALSEKTKTLPMIVLINRLTASGAELVAAALQDHQRAQIIGETSKGKGTIETVYWLGGKEAFKLSTGSLYRPNGKPLESAGVSVNEFIETADNERVSLLPDFQNDRVLREALSRFK